MGPELLVLIFALVVFGVIGQQIGSAKGRGLQGFWFGFFLGPIGWVIVALFPPLATPMSPTRPCPHCAEQIQPAAVLCRFCGQAVQPA